MTTLTFLKLWSTALGVMFLIDMAWLGAVAKNFLSHPARALDAARCALGASGAVLSDLRGGAGGPRVGSGAHWRRGRSDVPVGVANGSWSFVSAESAKSRAGNSGRRDSLWEKVLC